MCNIHISLSMYFYTFLADTADKKSHVAYSSNALEIRTNCLLIFVVLGNTQTFILSQKILLLRLSLRMDLRTFKWVSVVWCPTRCHCVTPGTRQRREEQSGKHRGSHGLLRVVDLGRIDTDSVLMWQLSVQHGRRAAPLGMCFVYKQTAPRRPGKRSVPADCWLQAANCHLVPARNYSYLASGESATLQI